MSDSPRHILRRCVATELSIVNHLQHWKRDFNHIDEMCTQLYMDELKHGFNTKLVHSLPNLGGQRRK